MALLAGSRVRPKRMYHTWRPLSQVTGACDVLAWAQDSQGTHWKSGCSIFLHPGHLHVPPGKESNHHTRHQRDRPALLSSPVERAANTLNQATKIRCGRDSTPWRGVHRGAGSATEHAVRGQQLGLK